MNLELSTRFDALHQEISAKIDSMTKEKCANIDEVNQMLEAKVDKLHENIYSDIRKSLSQKENKLDILSTEVDEVKQGHLAQIQSLSHDFQTELNEFHQKLDNILSHEVNDKGTPQSKSCTIIDDMHQNSKINHLDKNALTKQKDHTRAFKTQNPAKIKRTKNVHCESSSESASEVENDADSSDDESYTKSSRQVKYKHVKLPPFTGKEKWEVWLNRFEAVADRRAWSTNDKLDELLPRLQGAAGDFVFSQLSGKTRNSYKKAYQRVRGSFQANRIKQDISSSI